MLDIIKGILGLIALVLVVIFAVNLVGVGIELGNEISSNGIKSIIDRVWMGTNREGQ